MIILGKEISFPPVDKAGADGLLAIGGDLSTERLLLAYREGIFPWYNEDEPVCWWSPDPRFVLFPAELKVSKSMQRIIKNGPFRFTMNEAFGEVITSCRNIKRKDQLGTWIQQDVIAAYTTLHQLGFAISAEAWHGNTLAGGLYGVLMGNIFFGESMFSNESNASKFAFIQLVHHLQQKGLQLIDCQVYTAHLESLGARMINRKHFIEMLKAAL
ncbi:MAG: leucyl/phenylalanyl-tRNA--protein transferase [Bacteroidetes bacterium]|nr:leucyl/phenylalanyl-tRNA--protein transferase [Bacteroidota bacterium]